MKFQVNMFNSLGVMARTKNVDRRTDGRTDARTDGRTHRWTETITISPHPCGRGDKKDSFKNDEGVGRTKLILPNLTH
jgi:hypothetical protein